MKHQRNFLYHFSIILYPIPHSIYVLPSKDQFTVSADFEYLFFIYYVSSNIVYEGGHFVSFLLANFTQQDTLQYYPYSSKLHTLSFIIAE